MKRALFIMPVDTDFSTLPEPVQAMLTTSGFQYVAPCPGTVIKDGLMVADGISHTDDLTPEHFDALGWTLLGYWQWDGKADTLITHEPLSEALLPYLPDTYEYDEEGEVINTTPPTLHMPHCWAGWQEISDD